MRTIPACLLLLIGILCAAFLPHGGGGSVTACVTGVPSPDGTVYLPPSNCTISDSGGNVWAIGPSDGFQQVLQENGAAVLCCGGGHLRDNGIAIADTHTFMWQWRLTPGLGATLDCVPETPSNIWFWLHNDTFANVPFQQTAGPGSAITPASFRVTNSGVTTNYYNLDAAAQNVATNGTIGIPAPPSGQLLWDTGGIITKNGVTIQGDVGAAIGCASYGSGGMIQLDANNITIAGADATHLLTIEGMRQDCNGCIDGIRIRSDAKNVTIQNVFIQYSDNCIESSGNNGGLNTFTNLYLRNCGIGPGGFDHNIYLGWYTFTIQPDIDNAVVNGGSSINVKGGGHLWKDRYAYTTMTNYTIGCDSADTNVCDVSNPMDFPCGGTVSLSHIVIEMAAGLETSGAIGHGAETTSNGNGGCPAVRGMNGVTSTSGSNVLNVTTDPATLGIAIGDDISNAVQNPASTPANQNASWPVHSLITGLTSSTITINGNATKNGSNLWATVSGPTHFTGNTVSGTNQITGITLNPQPIGAAAQSVPTTSAVTSNGVWAGYAISGPGIPTGATVNTTGGSVGAYTVTINCPDLTTTCITSSNTGAAYQALRVHSLDLGNCIIINDSPRGPISVVQKSTIIGAANYPVTVHDCVLVNNPGSSNMILGTGVTDGGGNTTFASRAAAGYAAFPFLPSPP